MIVLSLDPGETTGYAVLDFDYFPVARDHSLGVIESGVISKWRGISKMMAVFTPEVVVAEQYRLYPGLAKQQSFSTMVVARVLGVIEFLCEEANIPLIEQASSVGKSFKLPTEMHAEYRNAHIRDCLRHALAYQKTQR